MAMLRCLPIICLLLMLAACKMEQHDRDSLPVSPENEIFDVPSIVISGISDAELQMYAGATHLAGQLEIDPATEAGSMKPIVESCGLTLERYHEIRMVVEENARLRKKNEQLLKKLRD